MTTNNNAYKAKGSLRRRFVVLIGLPLLVVGALLAIYLYSASKDFYFKQINELVISLSGYTLSKNSPLEFSLLPRPRLTARGLEVSNPRAGGHALLARVDRISFVLDWIPLLLLRLELDLELEGSRITLTVTEEGEKSWMTEELLEITGGLPFDLQHISSEATELIFQDLQQGEILGFETHQLDLDVTSGQAFARIETAGRFSDYRFFAIGEASYRSEDHRLEVDLTAGAGLAPSTPVDTGQVGSVNAWIEQNAWLFPVQGSVNGAVILDKDRFSGELNVDASLATLDELIPRSGIMGLRPGLGPVDASGTLTFSGTDVDLRGLELGLLHQAVVAEVEGDINNLLSTRTVDLGLRGNIPDPGAVLAVTEDIAHLGPLKLSAHINGEAGLYRISNSMVELDDGDIRTTLRGSISGGEELVFDIETAIEVNNTRILLNWTPKADVPFLDNLSLVASADIKGTAEQFSIDEIDAVISRDERELTIQGHIAGLPAGLHSGLRSVIEYHYSSVEPIELEEFFPKLESLQIAGPLDLAGRLQLADGVISGEDLSLKAEQSDIVGNVMVDLNISPARIEAIFESDQLQTKLVSREAEEDVEPPESAAQVEVEPPTDEQVKQQEKAFQDYLAGVDIETDWIRDLNLYFKLNSHNARIGVHELKDHHITLEITDGVFTLFQYELVINDRPISISGVIDTNTDPPSYRLSGSVAGDTLEELLKTEEQIFAGGRLNGNFELRTEGKDLGQALAGLEGQALIQMGPLDINSNALSFFSSDIVTSMLRGVTSRQEGQRVSSYECAVLGVDVRKGIAEMNKSFAMESKDYNLAGRGEINLNTGYVDLTVRPKARRGLGLSVSTLVGGFRIKGHMAAPNFGVGGGGLVSAVVAGYALTPTVTAAAASNPATATILATGFIAKGIFDRLTARGFTCEKTLERIDRNRQRLINRESRNPHHSGKMTF